jgi:hypothetical protein
MTEDLDIPTCLQRPDTPELAAARAKLVTRLNSQDVRTVPRTERAKVERDAQGRALPKNLDAQSRALLREMEKTAAKEAAEAQAERLRLLQVARDEKARVRREAREAHR